MKQAVLFGAGDLRLTDLVIDPNDIQETQVYVQTEVTALSTGTDLGNYLGRSTEVPGAPSYPRRVGYSNVGRVVHIGSRVEAFQPGQRVFSTKPHQSAFIASQDDLLVAVPAAVSSEQASLAYLAQLSLAAMRQARYQSGEHVVVVGLGVIGLAAVGLARAMGAKVAAIANSPLRAEAALAVGAHVAFLADNLQTPQDLQEAFGPTGADLVILTANPWPAYRLSVEIARKGGRVSILGFPGRGHSAPDFNPLDPQWLYAKQLTLLGAGFAPTSDVPSWELRFNVRRNIEYIFELMACGDLSLETLISHRLPADRLKEAYELAKQHDKALVAALFDWRLTAGR